MPKRFPLPRIFGVLAAMACACAVLGLAAQAAPAKQEIASDQSGIIILDVATPKGQGQLPPVAFDHNLHTRGENAAESCVNCHDGASAKNKAVFRDVAGKSGKELENAFHTGCVSCHADLKAKNLASGPQKAECRSCHNPSALPARDAAAQKKVDGGFDASLHARHIASPMIVAPGSAENCAACHHPLLNPISPDLKADSCRSCHQSRGETSKAAFADVAHGKCISCHLALAPSGVKAPVTCAACHNAAAKAEYAKLTPAPRLQVGQPDSVAMGVPPSAKDSAVPTPPPAVEGALPDAELDAATQRQPSMPPVVFNHKLHEAATESCVGCHHNTLQKCSSCHTPDGNDKGGKVTLMTAMHSPTSNASCVGCHETRKTAAPECAGCHAVMPKSKAAQSNCASCHVPPAASPAGAAKPDLASIIAAAPETVSIGAMANEYEPVAFAHRQHIEKLVAGIDKTSPGMMRFHAEPYALCASCHHNSPLSATPPTCASCHAKGTGDLKAALQQNERPELKTAYHQQCMSCHTSMGLAKPANADCASCHAKRAPGR